VGTICEDNTSNRKQFLNVYCGVGNPAPWDALKLHTQLHNTLYMHVFVRARVF